MDKLESLQNLFKNESWFYSVGSDKFNRPVLYVNYLNKELINFIRSKSQDNFLIHYASYAMCNKSKYVTLLNKQADSIPDDLDTKYLIDEVEYLQSICKRSMLQDIFFEVHDGTNAVTSLSQSFPEIRQSINDLYHIYGYDLLYEELEK